MPGHNDPTDVFPRRNLPTSAEPWGRSVENRVISNQDRTQSLQQSVLGLNRNVSSQISQITDQLQRLVDSTRVVGISALVTNTPGGMDLWAGGSVIIERPSWATHALVEFTAMTVTDYGDMTGEVAITFQAFDVDEGLAGGQISAIYLVDSAGSFATESQPLVIEVPSDYLEFWGYAEPTIAGSGSLSIQVYSKVTWIQRGVQTTGDI